VLLLLLLLRTINHRHTLLNESVNEVKVNQQSHCMIRVVDFRDECNTSILAIKTIINKDY